MTGLSWKARLQIGGAVCFVGGLLGLLWRADAAGWSLLAAFVVPGLVDRLLLERACVRQLRALDIRCSCQGRMCYSYSQNGFTCEACGRYEYWSEVLRLGGIGSIPADAYSLADAIRRAR